MNKWLASAVVAGTFAMTTPAMAATNIPLTETVPGSGVYDGGLVTAVSSATFTDEYEFTVPVPGTIASSVITLTITGALSLTSVLLNNTPLGITVNGTTYTASTMPGGVPTGTNPQTLVVSGKLDKTQSPSGSYSVNIQYSSAVPEPATWALMILGFGVVGYSMRRRQAVRFAQAI